MYNKKSIILLLVVFMLGLETIAQENKVRITDGWEYVKGDLGSVWEAFRPIKQSKLPTWNNVQMPHCFNAFDAVDPDVPYYQGPGWYRNFLEIENPYTNGRVILHFEGAGQKTDIYIYQTKVSRHVGGYDEFKVDVTDAVAQYRNSFPDAKTIPVAIRCDNSRDVNMIPSDLSDFNVYGGLYRYVNLEYVPEVSFDIVHMNYVLNDKLNSAQVNITASLKNSLQETSKLDLKIELISSSGKVVYTQQMSLDSWDAVKEIASFTIKKPQLWHPESPNLYQLKLSLADGNNSHESVHNVGFSKFEFKKKGPLFVNGERLLLRGTHRHEDHAGYAAAMPEKLMRDEMILMKEMGVNFIRLGHYQQSPIILELCDSLGILVWEEIPWCRGGLGGDIYKEQARRMLTNMINQHHNHASILIWGLGNENDWPGDFDVFDKEKIRTFMKELHDLSHKLDPERKTAIRRCNFCKDIIDVYSPSIWAGWYRGKFTNYQQVSYDEAMQVNHFLHVEWGASHHAGRHSETPDKGLAAISGNGADERDGDFLSTGGDPRVSKDGDWSETYACNLIDWHLKEQEKMDWLTGTAYWPFKDFSTPLRPENPIPYVNQKGVVQRDLAKKESFYVFQSYWTQKPMAHIYGHTWETRWGDKDEFKLVKVYSNCEKAELFLNGKSVGLRERNSQDYPAAGLRWKVQFNEGENNIHVVAWQGKVKVEDEISFTYQTEKWEDAQHLKLEEVERFGDTVLVCAKVYDKNGIFIPDSKEFVEFEIAGDAILLDNLGTWDGSRKLQLYNGRAFMKIKKLRENCVISVKSEKIPVAFLNLNN